MTAHIRCDRPLPDGFKPLQSLRTGNLDAGLFIIDHDARLTNIGGADLRFHGTIHMWSRDLTHRYNARFKDGVLIDIQTMDMR